MQVRRLLGLDGIGVLAVGIGIAVRALGTDAAFLNLLRGRRLRSAARCAFLAGKLGDEPLGLALGCLADIDPCIDTFGHVDGIAGLEDPPELSVGTAQGELLAENHGEEAAVGIGDLDVGHAAADAHEADGGLHLDPALVLGQLAADEPHDALGETGDQLALAGIGVIDELVDHQVGVRADGEGRAVEQKHLDQAAVAGLDPFLESELAAEHDGAGRSAGRMAGRIGVDRRGNADFRCGLDRKRCHAERQCCRTGQVSPLCRLGHDQNLPERPTVAA